MRRMGGTVGRWWRASLPGRLCADRAGNVLMLSAAMLVPLMAVMGSGIDLGRVYVARSRMQQACDAASLAGRWAVASGVGSDQIKAEALKYFKFNFDYTAGPMGTASFTPAVAVESSGNRAVSITAKTTIPLSMMKMFGFKTMPVQATCTAQQDFVNIDVVLVLDVTGSMLDTIDGDSQSKISGLRKAVLALYDQLALVEPKLNAANMRLRYGIVSYASTVNVGRLIYKQNKNWIRDPAPYENGKSVDHQTSWFGDNGDWDGCIEERGTVNTITSSTTSIPTEAYDLSIDGIPDNNKSQTKWPAYDADSKDEREYCPINPAVRLQEWSQSDFYAYINKLNPQNSGATTYHDIGMAWGGRLISSGGIFADSPDLYNGMPTKRYLIFMTDGQLNANPSVYSAWGREDKDRRTTTSGTSTASNATHQMRTTLLCSAIKTNASIWVVGFGDPLDSYMKNCASNAGQVSNNASSDQLVETFKAIGKSIGALRLSE